MLGNSQFITNPLLWQIVFKVWIAPFNTVLLFDTEKSEANISKLLTEWLRNLTFEFLQIIFFVNVLPKLKTKIFQIIIHYIDTLFNQTIQP